MARHGVGVKGPINHSLGPDTILFLRIGDHAAFKKPWKSDAFMKWVKKKSPLYPNVQFHHVWASKHALKSTDLLGVALTPELHAVSGKHRNFNETRAPEAILNLLQWAQLLEEENQYLRKHHKLPER